MRSFLTLLLLLSTTPALAQFPPPGIYACTSQDDAPVGELTLMVGGDYHFRDAPTGYESTGQLASAGNQVTPVSGLLNERRLRGAFETDDTGKTVFRFNGPEGLIVTCQ